MPYTIMITEAQRARIVKALELLERTDPVQRNPTSPDHDVNLAYLVAALEVVPSDEAESPGVIHGLCL